MAGISPLISVMRSSSASMFAWSTRALIAGWFIQSVASLVVIGRAPGRKLCRSVAGSGGNGGDLDGAVQLTQQMTDISPDGSRAHVEQLLVGGRAGENSQKCHTGALAGLSIIHGVTYHGAMRGRQPELLHGVHDQVRGWLAGFVRG